MNSLIFFGSSKSKPLTVICLLILISILVKSEGLNAQSFELITDSVKMFWPPQAIEKPGYLESITEPDFGTKITRVTGDPGTTIPVIGNTWKDIARHGYSKIPAWNADESLLYLETQKGGPSQLYLDGETYEVLFSRKVSANEKRWHPTNPELMIGLTNNSVISWNVWTSEIKTLISFSGYTSCQMGPWEGNLSYDGNWVGVYATRISDNMKVGFALDLKNAIKYPDIDLPGISVDWISISAKGTYLVLHGTIAGGDDQTQVYDLDGNKVGSLWNKYGRPSHYDLTIDENGDEVAVGVSKSSPDNGRVIKRRLSDGVVTVLTKGGYATHTSTRCYGRPGWAISSYNHRGPNWEPYYNEAVAIKLDGSRVERICHVRTLYDTYDNEAQPCPSPSGGRIIFASDWESGGLPIQGYVADFREMKIPFPVSSIDKNTTIRIYPNPASEFIIIPNRYFKSDYRIISLNGQIMQRGRIETNRVNILRCNPGYYIIEFKNSSEVNSYPFSVIKN